MEESILDAAKALQAAEKRDMLVRKAKKMLDIKDELLRRLSLCDEALNSLALGIDADYNPSN